ncbi:hypothetical protein GXB85_04530 [Cellulomonas sp. APG4]|uniref:hypothetical protein n=1 Tax=Cellulomonas sp. APG4 TaxID=1538656 RepID=UPI00137B6FE1|nr:hypothetical protein [Cellulomonas sp. APG4]NCT90220.1 hypothetical protein [Cellulomonas sp. APG4]
MIITTHVRGGILVSAGAQRSQADVEELLAAWAPARTDDSSVLPPWADEPTPDVPGGPLLPPVAASVVGPVGEGPRFPSSAGRPLAVTA